YFASHGGAASVSSNFCVTRLAYAYMYRTQRRSSTCASFSSSCASPSRRPRSSPYEVVSCPISVISRAPAFARFSASRTTDSNRRLRNFPRRSEEHTSELQSPDHLVCRLLLEKKNQKPTLSA